MRELHVVSVSEDGRHVLLSARKGGVTGEFQVALDRRLAAALRGELPRPGETTAPVVSLTPKEIQARLRAGESSEQIAASAGVPVARVERFAGPVLSEREGVIRAAQAAVLVRSRRGPSDLALGEAVAQHLASSPGYKPESTVWSARREDTGAWVVRLTYVARARKRTASWRYEPRSREVSPLDAGSAALAHVDVAEGVRISARAATSASTRVRAPAPPAAARRAPRPPAVAPTGGAAARKVAVATPATPATPVTRAARPTAARSAAPTTPTTAAGGTTAPAARSTAAATKTATAKTATKAPATKTATEAPTETALARPAAPQPPPVDVAAAAAEGPTGPPLLRVVPGSGTPTPPATSAQPPVDPPPEEAPVAPPPPPPAARRAAGGRATVPAWADVLLGIAPTAPPGDDRRAEE